MHFFLCKKKEILYDCGMVEFGTDVLTAEKRKGRSGQAMVEYIIVAVILMVLVSVCSLLLYTLRGQSTRVLDLVSSEYP